MNPTADTSFWRVLWDGVAASVAAADAVAVGVVVVVMLIGLKHGLAGELARIGALAAALACAWFFATPVADWMTEHTRLAPEAARATAFVGIALIAWLVAGLVRFGLRNLLELQFKGGLNRVGGLLLGAVKGVAIVYIVGAALLLVPAFREPDGWLVTSTSGGWILRTFPDLYARTLETFPELKSPVIEEAFGPPGANGPEGDLPPEAPNAPPRW